MLTGGRLPARLVVAAMVLVAGCSTGSRDESAPTTTVREEKVAPRWDRLARLTGSGDQVTERFEVAPEALQWRVTVACDGAGSVRVGLDGEVPALAVVDGCPGSSFGYSIRTGPATLDVVAGGTWEVVVDQQLDTPVAEAALPGMTAAARVAAGELYGIDQEGAGTATLYRFDGEAALRLDPFVVTRNSDLFVWLSDAPAPRTSREALDSRHVQVARLTATAGAQNYRLPDTVDLDWVRSVIVWCEPVRSAYAAASLSP